MCGTTADQGGHPTKVEVYTDNHGEGMVYLNGDWNLNLGQFLSNGAADVLPGATVGTTRYRPGRIIRTSESISRSSLMK